MMKRIFHERKFNAVVRLLDGEEFQTEVTKSTHGRDVFELVCQHIGLQETDFFGLKFVYQKDKQLSWLDNAKTLGKQMGHGPYHLVFQVKFYPPNPAAVNEDITRYQIVLQVRDDLLKERLICSVPIHALLASYLIQAEKGDYDPSEHPEDYIDGLQFMPNQDDRFLEKVHEFHIKHKNLMPADAEFQYLDNARKIPLYGMDLHEALDGDGTNIVLGVSGSGIHVILKGREMSKFSWSNIHKVYFKSKRFFLDVRVVTEVEYEDLTIGFHCRSRTEMKRLYRSAVDRHTFFRRDALVHGQQKVSFFRLGSRFRYSGKKTLQQLKTTNPPRPSQTFQRVPSQRLSSAHSRSKNESAEISKTNAPQTVKDPGTNEDAIHQNTELNNCEDNGSPSISRNAVISPAEEVDSGRSDNSKPVNNGLAVKITISPPTPVPGERRAVGAEDSCEDFTVIESDENGTEEGGEDVKSPEGPPLQAEEMTEGSFAQPEEGSGQETVIVEKKTMTRVETADSESFEEITSKVEMETTVTTRIVTKTEVITVGDLNEETVLVDEEHIEERNPTSSQS